MVDRREVPPLLRDGTTKNNLNSITTTQQRPFNPLQTAIENAMRPGGITSFHYWDVTQLRIRYKSWKIGATSCHNPGTSLFFYIIRGKFPV